jgi:hypothetical protein
MLTKQILIKVLHNELVKKKVFVSLAGWSTHLGIPKTFFYKENDLIIMGDLPFLKFKNWSIFTGDMPFLKLKNWLIFTGNVLIFKFQKEFQQVSMLPWNCTFTNDLLFFKFQKEF